VRRLTYLYGGEISPPCNVAQTQAFKTPSASCRLRCDVVDATIRDAWTVSVSVRLVSGRRAGVF